MNVRVIITYSTKNFPLFAVTVYFAISGKMKIQRTRQTQYNGFTIKKMFAILEHIQPH